MPSVIDVDIVICVVLITDTALPPPSSVTVAMDGPG